jgi:hypothetical protein
MSTNPSSQDNHHRTTTVTGGCHCGAIRYKATIDMSNLQPTKCNCSYCHKTNFVAISVDSAEDDGHGPGAFEFLPGSSSDTDTDTDEQQGQYAFGPKDVRWSFCKVCGVAILAQGEYKYNAGDGVVGRRKTRVINAVTLDQGQEGLDFSKIKIRYFNGREHGWDAKKQDEPAEWGTW